MRGKKALVPVLVCALLLCACDYIVLPEDLDSYTSTKSEGWSAVVTNVKSDAGDLHIDLTIQNKTGDWSAMQATATKPAVLTTGDGKTTNCDTVFVSTGGHRLAPGFQMRGYIGGTKAEQKTQLIYVECKGAEAASGSTLAIDYSYVTGEYNYYYPDESKVDATLEVKLDEVATDLTYPIAEEIEGLVQKPDAEITAINDVTLLLTGDRAHGYRPAVHVADPTTPASIPPTFTLATRLSSVQMASSMVSTRRRISCRCPSPLPATRRNGRPRQRFHKMPRACTYC